MNAAETEQKIKEIVADQLGYGEYELGNDQNLVDDLGADSLDLVELAMAIEEEFEVEIQDEDAPGLLTITKISEYVRERLK